MTKELFAHHISSLSSNLGGHLSVFSAELAKGVQEANALNDMQTVLITVTAHALIIHDILTYPSISPEGRAQLEAILVNIITNFDGANG